MKEICTALNFERNLIGADGDVSRRRDLTNLKEIYMVVMEMLRRYFSRRNFNKFDENPYGADGDVTPLATSEARGRLVMI